MKLIYFSRWIYVQQVCFLLLTLVLKVIKKTPVGKIGIFVYFCSFLLERTSQKKGCLVVNKQIVVGPTFFTTAEMLIFYAVNRLGQNGDALQDLQVGCCWCLNHLFWVVLKKKRNYGEDSHPIILRLRVCDVDRLDKVTNKP